MIYVYRDKVYVNVKMDIEINSQWPKCVYAYKQSLCHKTTTTFKHETDCRRLVLTSVSIHI